jgi:hypothetical protein
MRSPANGTPSVRPVRQRSAVTNGRFFAVDRRLDTRTNGWVRRFADLFEIYIAHLGGHDAVSAPERSIIRRIATLDVELESLEKRFALSSKGASAEDLDLYSRVSNSLDRKLQQIGFKRTLRDITPPPSWEDIGREEAAEKDDVA